jgi:peptide/nickel transport system permease protein
VRAKPEVGAEASCGGVSLGPGAVERRVLGARAGVPIGFRRLPLRAKAAFVWIVLLVVVAVFAPLIAPYPAERIGAGELSSPPDFPHIMGTDEAGRDTFSRVVVATRVSVIAGLAAPLAALVLGGLIGAVAAAASRWLDEILMRLMDIQFAFPAVVLALVFATILGPSLKTTIILLTIVYAPIMARLVRANVLAQLGEDYVAAERALGSSMRRILLRHVSVNIATPTLVFFTLVAADAVVLEAALSFLGAGVRPPTPSWGNLIRDGQAQMLAGTWWLTVFPGVAILAAVLALNTLAESVADRIGGRRYLLGQQ